MYIFSEKTNKRYGSVEACLEAEREYEERLKKEEEERERFRTEFEERKTEVRDAFRHARSLLAEFEKDFGKRTYWFYF